MGVRNGNLATNPFKSMPNFRALDCQPENASHTYPTKLYRSSRPDFLTQEEVEIFQKELGIKCIIDVRSVREYKRANGRKLLNDSYPGFKVQLPRKMKYKPGDQVEAKPVKLLANARDLDQNLKHYFMDFFKLNYVWAIYNRAPLYVRLYSLLFLILDLILMTNFVYFVRIFAKNVLNKQGLVGQYIDMLHYSQAQICAALKLLSNRENVPALINCAHGKDRTGMISAMVLGCLGKSNEYIAYDYAKSETELAPMKERCYKEIVERFHMCESFTTAKAETMLHVLQYIDNEFGSIKLYLESIGFTETDQENLRRNLQVNFHNITMCIYPLFIQVFLLSV
ncbi:hypothetical protein CAPTEDRAFT_211304 [Capitella teleta]|uniref:Tyrosine specific protein phosphatases domain-containing protein n=1 Tax=Capitella teleta TaxID=283909 RepID=R7TRF3_CAPTE|nr:hypothetical protein CAPTEDRAFT_211304 [Capitella teleta]|eukprot:ELT93610.1 hypothetical protein CAPTEDRAFT_211304 [Capitella teleta]